MIAPALRGGSPLAEGGGWRGWDWWRLRGQTLKAKAEGGRALFRFLFADGKNSHSQGMEIYLYLIFL